MAFVHGKSATFSLDTAGSSAPVDISGKIDDISMPRNVDTAEVSALGDSDKSYLVGLRDATFSISGPWDATIDDHISGLLGGGSYGFTYSPDGGTTLYTGECFVTSYEVSSPVSDRVAWSADAQVSGAISRA